MEPPFPGADDDGTPAKPPAANSAASPTSPTAPELSDAVVRFRSCRWYQPPENGNADFCTHREVKPYAGTTGFDHEACCVDCQYYKLRRAPKKRNPDDYRD